MISTLPTLPTIKRQKKKAKTEEIARVTKLDLKNIIEEAKLPKNIQFEPSILEDHRKPKVNILSNIDATDPLALLNLFIPPKIYTTIAQNTNYTLFPEMHQLHEMQQIRDTGGLLIKIKFEFYLVFSIT